nr:JmjC domain-containing protein [Tanacetum cinerariifolium]
MAALRYKDEHNKVGYLLKPTGSDDYHQIIDFLMASHVRSPELGPLAIQATIDKTSYTITEDLSGSWDQFGSLIAVALICLSDGRRFNWSSYIFKGMVSNIGNAKKFFMLNFEGHPMPLLPAILLQAHASKGAKVAAHAVPQHMPTPDQPQDHLSQILLHSLDLMRLLLALSPMWKMNLWAALSICLHQGPLKLLLQKVNSLETELKDHKKLFKDVVGKLVKKVKAMEVKLKTKKMKMVVSDYDQEKGEKQYMDLDALRALANAAVTVDSNISPGGASNNLAASTSVFTAVPTGANAVPADASTIPPGSPSVPTDVSPSVAPAGVLNKGKSPMVEEDIPVKARTFKQMEEDRLGEEAAKRLHHEEQAQLDRQRAELQQRRRQEVLDSAMYYTEADWINIMAQVKANASLSKTLLGDDVSEDNFPARMAALIKRKRQALAEKLAQEMQNRPMNQA